MAKSTDGLPASVATDAASSLLSFPGIGPVLSFLFTGMVQEIERNASKALKAAERSSGRSREDLADLLKDEPRAAPLVLKVLWAAGMNGHDQTLLAMGAVLGSGLDAIARDSGDDLEDAEIALAAIAELRPRHWRVLAAAEDLTDDPEGATVVEQIASKANITESATSQCLTQLASAGLVRVGSGYGGLLYTITNLGRAVLEAANVVQDL